MTISKKEGRLQSVDAFRGATIALMVLVNNAGDGDHSYSQLKHSAWNGWTITDVVFPTFLFIVGIAITLAGRKSVGVVFRRSLIIFALGLLVYLFPHFDFTTMRFLGVLQRIALCYLAVSLIYLRSDKLLWIVSWIAILLVSYWLLMMLVPVPGYGAGRLDIEGNFAHYIDRLVLGRHNYVSTKSWDPEGVVSTLPAIATTLFGVLAGGVLRSPRSLWERTTLLFVSGNALLVAGIVCSQWLPINKKLWTSSFCVFMAGLGFLLLAMFVYFVDLRNHQAWFKPFIILGRNAIVIYMLSELLAELLQAIQLGRLSLQNRLYQSIFVPLASPSNASLLWAIAFTTLMYLVAYAMYKKNLIVRI